jgi:hypothetical protein
MLKNMVANCLDNTILDYKSEFITYQDNKKTYFMKETLILSETM